MNICDKIIKLIKNKEKHASGKMGGWMGGRG